MSKFHYINSNQETLITLTAPSLEGGIGRNVVNLASCWVEKGFHVNLIIDKVKNQNFKRMPDSVKILETRSSHPITALPWLVGYLRKHRPSALLTPVPRHTAWAIRARFVSRVPIRIAANVHNNYLESLSRLNLSKQRSRTKLLRRFYPLCDAIIPVSKGAAKAFSELTHIGLERLTPLPNPVLPLQFEKLAAETVEHPWFQYSEPPVIIWVGRLEPQKELGVLLNAFENIRMYRACRLVIIGDGSEGPNLALQAKKSPFSADIQFLGEKSNPYCFVKRSAVLVLSSRFEGFGNVLVEAMALGTPVASVDCPSGPSEILQAGKLGPLTPVGDAMALARGIEQCLTSPISPIKLKEAAKPYYASEAAEKYLQVMLSRQVTR